MSTRGFVINNGVLEKYTGSAEDVSIPEGVEEIWGTAFFKKNPKRIILPGSVTSIGQGAFGGINLTEIDVAEDNKTFCSIDGVLYSKDRTKLVCFPQGRAEYYMIPTGVTSIGGRAFWHCERLIEVTMPDSVIEIGAEAFRDCSALEKCTLSKSLTHIGDGAFAGCKGIRSITIPEGVTYIGDYAFSSCTELNHLAIPEGVEHIGKNAFYYCKGLADENGCIIVRGTLYLYTGNGGDVVIPKGVTAIANSAFANCSSLTSVTIPDSVTSIGNSAFSGCRELTSVMISDGPTAIGENAFYGCSKLENLIIPNGVTTIGDGMLLWCTGLKRVSVPGTIASIGKDVLPDGTGCLIEIGDLGRLPAALRPNAALCFAEDGGKADDPRFESHCKYIKTNAVKLMNAAMKHPVLLSLMCREKLIKPKDIDVYLAEAEKRGDAEKKALLLNYQNELGSKAVEKARAKKEKVKEDYTDALAERIAARDPEKGIEGMTFVITGDLDKWKSRKELQAYLEQYEAKIGSSVTKKTDYLVTNDMDSGSEKNRKARELGVPIITEDELNELLRRG